MPLDDPVDQFYSDAGTLLTLWARAAPDGKVPLLGDRLRLMKLAFLFDHALAAKQIDALGLTFTRWKLGPVCNAVFDLWEMLQRGGMVIEEEAFFLTPDGRDLAASWYDEVLSLEENAPTRRVFDDTAARWRNEPSTRAIVAAANEIAGPPANGQPSIPGLESGLGEAVVGPVLGRPTSRFRVGAAWLETIAIMLNPAAMAGIRAAEDDFRAGRYVEA